MARYHARAIYTVEVSLRQQQDGGQPRYGQTLAITVGLFIFLWAPFQVRYLLFISNYYKIHTYSIHRYLRIETHTFKLKLGKRSSYMY